MSRSRRLMLGTVSAHVLPLLCLLGEGVPVWCQWGLSLLALISAGVSAARWRSLRGLRLLVAGDGGVWLLQPAARTQIEVLPDSVDLGWLIILHWRELASPRTRRAALCRDGVPAEDWRALRRFLRWQVGVAQGS